MRTSKGGNKAIISDPDKNKTKGLKPTILSCDNDIALMTHIIATGIINPLLKLWMNTLERSKLSKLVIKAGIRYANKIGGNQLNTLLRNKFSIFLIRKINKTEIKTIIIAIKSFIFKT